MSGGLNGDQFFPRDVEISMPLKANGRIEKSPRTSRKPDEQDHLGGRRTVLQTIKVGDSKPGLVKDVAT